MLQYRFDTTQDLISFLLNTPEFLEWEVITCRFSATNGLNFNMNTAIVDTLGQSGHVKLKFILPTVENFYKTIVGNSYSELNIEIKLQLPEILKSNFDPNNEYYGFFLSTYSDGLTIVSNSSHLEKNKESGLMPLTNWDTYYSQLYQQWYNKYKNSLEKQ